MRPVVGRLRRRTIAVIACVVAFWILRATPESGVWLFVIGVLAAILVAFRPSVDGRVRRGQVIAALAMAVVASLAIPGTPDAFTPARWIVAAAAIVGAAATLTDAMRAPRVGLIAATDLVLAAFVALSLVIPPIFTYGSPAPGALESATAFFRVKEAIATALFTVLPLLVTLEDLQGSGRLGALGASAMPIS